VWYKSTELYSLDAITALSSPRIVISYWLVALFAYPQASSTLPLDNDMLFLKTVVLDIEAAVSVRFYQSASLEYSATVDRAKSTPARATAIVIDPQEHRTR